MYYSPGLSLEDHRARLAGVGHRLFVDQVIEALATSEPRDCSKVRIAETLGVSETTLSRRLARSGKKFSDLADADRARRCKELLQRLGNRAYGNILAQELGYQCPNSFYRAFRRWFGVHFCPVRTGYSELPPIGARP